jgi:hypothetical protein
VDAVNLVNEALKCQLGAHGRDEVNLAVNEDEGIKLGRHERRLHQLFGQVYELASNKLGGWREEG